MSGWKDQMDAPWTPPARAFDGGTYRASRDHERLKGQLFHVYRVLSDGQWWTLARLSEAAAGSEAAVSARLRDLRKPKYGGHTIERRHVSGGLFEYRMVG